MADLTDVEYAIAGLVAATVYPDGVTSVIGSPVKIFAGWPLEETLDRDLAAGTCSVSVYNRPGGSRNTTRYAPIWMPGASTAATVTITISGRIATFAGTATPGQAVGLLVDGVGYAVLATSGDGPATLAKRLASQIPGATVNGAQVFLPAGSSVVARTGATTQMSRELRRQEQQIDVIVWAPTPALRSALSSVVDVTLAQTDFLPLPDGTSARLTYQMTAETDAGTAANVYRRTITSVVEYATTQTQTAMSVLFPTGTVAVQGQPPAYAFGDRVPGSTLQQIGPPA
jgi:hypothetical protein